MTNKNLKLTAEIPPQGNNAETIKFVGEIPVTDKPGGKVVGVAKIEKLKSGALIAHVEMSPENIDLIATGFSFGSLSIAEDDDGTAAELAK